MLDLMQQNGGFTLFLRLIGLWHVFSICSTFCLLLYYHFAVRVWLVLEGVGFKLQYVFMYLQSVYISFHQDCLRISAILSFNHGFTSFWNFLRRSSVGKFSWNLFFFILVCYRYQINFKYVFFVFWRFSRIFLY